MVASAWTANGSAEVRSMLAPNRQPLTGSCSSAASQRTMYVPSGRKNGAVVS
jgi:hypothetical protein